MTKEMTIMVVVMTVVAGSRDWQVTLESLGSMYLTLTFY